MLVIGEVRIDDPDHKMLVKHFRETYNREERIGDIIAWYMEDHRVHRFDNIAQFRRKVLGIAQGSHLPIQFTHPTHPGPYVIEMTGSRHADFDEANKAAGLASTPGGYTWHHRENVRYNSINKKVWCQMYLIDTGYHSSVRHRGAVYEYELLKNCVYQ